MSDDQLILGGFTFDGFSTPSSIGAGGKHSMVVHKLPGGARVIDTLGPDEGPISWSGFFWGNNALNNAYTLDNMREVGAVVSLTFGGQFRSVIIDSFSYSIRRSPVWVEYRISCVVYQNAGLGAVGVVTSTIDTLILSDLAAAIGL